MVPLKDRRLKWKEQEEEDKEEEEEEDSSLMIWETGEDIGS